MDHYKMQFERIDRLWNTGAITREVKAQMILAALDQLPIKGGVFK